MCSHSHWAQIEGEQNRLDLSDQKPKLGDGIGAQRAATLIFCAESFPQAQEEILLLETFAIQAVFFQGRGNHHTLFENYLPHVTVHNLKIIKSECQWNCRQRWMSGGFESFPVLIPVLGQGKTVPGACVNSFQSHLVSVEGAKSCRMLIIPNGVLSGSHKQHLTVSYNRDWDSEKI